MGYSILKYLAYPFVRAFWLGRIRGIENLPKQGSYIIAANHKSYLDFILLFVFMPTKISFLAAEVFFKSPFWRPIMKITGQIKVDRKSSDKTEVHESVKNLMNNGGVLGIFPEGTRSRSGKLQKGHVGAVNFSNKYDVPIVPVGITNTFDALPPHKKIAKFKKCDINIGTPFHADDLDVESATRALMVKIADLSGEKYEY